jgi:hypothetical protein
VQANLHPFCATGLSAVVAARMRRWDSAVAFKRLGEILIERGVLALSELHTGLEACRRGGGRLGTHLLKLGFIAEASLLDALSEQLGVRAVPRAALESAPIDVVSLLPAGTARRLLAVPFERTAHYLRVAMVNPRDLMVLEEMGTLTGLEVVPCVATETAILAAISRLEGLAAEVVNDAVGLEPATDWDELWVPPRALPGRLLEVHPPPDRPSSGTFEVATFPGLASVGVDDAHPGAQPLDENVLRRRLATVEGRDEAGELILRYALGFFNRVCLFAVYQGSVVGWMAGGQGVVVDDLQTFSVPLEDVSLFHDFRSGTGYHLGPIPEGDLDSDLVRLLGDPKPASVVLLPIRVRDRAAAFLLGDNFQHDLVVPVDEMAAQIAAAGLAFEILILRNKILG